MIRKLSRSTVAILAATVPLVLVSSTPASAATAAVAVVSGSGTIAPGLTAIPAPQTFSFSGTASVTGVVCGVAEVAVSHSISASGSDLAGSYAAGAGSVSIFVSGNAGCPGGLTLTGTFGREGLDVEVAATAGTTAAVADCVFVPGQTPPAAVVSYSLTCEAEISGTA